MEAWTAPTAQPLRWLGAGSVLLVYFGWWGLARRRRSRSANGSAGSHGIDALLVVHASQTGTATELARRCADALRANGRAVELVEVGDLDIDRLAACGQVVFIAATTGEGEPPETALQFVRTSMTQAPDLGHLEYALLALGDRGYARFCAFGRALDGWLRRCGARPLFAPVEVDAGDPAALRRWHDAINVLAGGRAPLPDLQPAFQTWRLARRACLNPGSDGAPIHLLRLAPTPGVIPDWQPGAIASVRMQHPPARVEQFLDHLGAPQPGWPSHACDTLRTRLRHCRWPDPAVVRAQTFDEVLAALRPLPTRDYSIASTAADGCIDLVLRAQCGPDGELGLGSAWLCRDSAVGGTLEAHVRENPQFGLPPHDAPLILIGAGTGIAGLRGLLRGRIQAGARGNWLLFGERRRAHDALFDDELQGALRDGDLERLDRAFSRDRGDERYVQDLLDRRADLLRSWIEDGAHVRVCGSATTMGAEVDRTLRRLLGDARLDSLIADGRFHHDVY